MKEHNIIVAFGIKPELKEELQKEADEMGLTLSAYIRHVLKTRNR